MDCLAAGESKVSGLPAVRIWSASNKGKNSHLLGLEEIVSPYQYLDGRRREIFGMQALKLTNSSPFGFANLWNMEIANRPRVNCRLPEHELHRSFILKSNHITIGLKGGPRPMKIPAFISRRDCSDSAFQDQKEILHRR